MQVLPQTSCNSRADHKRLDLAQAPASSTRPSRHQKPARTANMNMIDDEAKSAESSGILPPQDLRV
jgi:hypothetical protein